MGFRSQSPPTQKPFFVGNLMFLLQTVQCSLDAPQMLIPVKYRSRGSWRQYIYTCMRVFTDVQLYVYMYMYIYVYACIRNILYVHTCIRRILYVHTCIQCILYVNTCTSVYECIRHILYVHTCIRSYMYTLIRVHQWIRAAEPAAVSTLFMSLLMFCRANVTD